MTHHTMRRAILFGAVLCLLFLCSCQTAGMSPLVLPPETPAPAPSQWKTQLLSSVNLVYQERLKIAGHFVRGEDAAAEAVLKYLQEECGTDAVKAAALLSENSRDPEGRVACADALQTALSPVSGETDWVSYATLPASALTTSGVLPDDMDFRDAAAQLIDHRALLVWSDSYSPSVCEASGFAVGLIGETAFVVMVSVS